MGDFTPVGNTGIIPPPGQGIDTLSSILGIQQRRQAMLIQNQELQRSQIQTQQASGVNDFFSSVDPGDVRGDDGTWDVDKAHSRQEYKSLPGVAKIAVDAQLNELRGQQLKNKLELSKLNGEVVGQLGKVGQSLSTDEDVKAGNPNGIAKVRNAFSSFAAQGPDNARALALYQPNIEKLIQHDPKHVSERLAALGSQAQDVTAQQSQTNPDIVSNAAGNLLAKNKSTGAISELPGAAVGSRLNPSSPTVAGQTARSSNLSGGEATIDTQRAEAVSTVAQNTQGQISLTKQADRLYEAISSGKFPAFSAQVMKDAGSNDPAVVARYELKKVLGDLKNTATSHAGSDKQLETQLEQFPDETTPKEVGHARMDSLRGYYRLVQERKDNLNAYQQKHGLGGFQRADDLVTSARSPLITELHALPPGSEERRAFLKRNFKGDRNAMQDAIEAEQAAYHVTGNGK